MFVSAHPGKIATYIMSPAQSGVGGGHGGGGRGSFVIEPSRWHALFAVVVMVIGPCILYTDSVYICHEGGACNYQALAPLPASRTRPKRPSVVSYQLHIILVPVTSTYLYCAYSKNQDGTHAGCLGDDARGSCSVVLFAWRCFPHARLILRHKRGRVSR